MLSKLSHISLTTNNLNKVKKFYVDLLGFKIVHKFTNDKKKDYGYFIYCGHGTFLEFFNSNKKINNEKSNFKHICFQIKNLNKMKKKLKKNYKKIEFQRGKTDNVLQFFIKDYENNVIEFHYHDKKSKLKKYI